MTLMKNGTNNIALKTFSFLDYESQDLLKINGEVVRIKAESHHHAKILFFEDGICDMAENWTNTGSATWCWEEMKS